MIVWPCLRLAVEQQIIWDHFMKVNLKEDKSTTSGNG